MSISNKIAEDCLPIIIVQALFDFLWDHWAHPGYFENWIPLKPVLGGICSLVNYSVHMKRLNQTESLISWFCVFFVSKGNPFLLLF